MFKNRTFKFSPEVSIMAILAAITCGYLSHWQYSRYLEKKDYFSLVKQQESRGVVPFIPNTTDWAPEYHAQVTLQGHWDHERAVVLINRSLESTPGVKVVTPLIVDDGKDGQIGVMVDRGFLPYDRFEEGWLTKQKDSSVITVVGFLRPSQHSAFSLAPPESAPKPGEFKQRWLRLTVESMAAQLPYSLPPVFVEQTNTGTDFPIYNEREIIGPPRHFNYCMQWASFGIFGLFVGFMLQMPKNKQMNLNQKPAQQALA